jgi:hypothetical protein
MPLKFCFELFFFYFVEETLILLLCDINTTHLNPPLLDVYFRLTSRSSARIPFASRGVPVFFPPRLFGQTLQDSLLDHDSSLLFCYTNIVMHSTSESNLQREAVLVWSPTFRKDVLLQTR